jgi:hypothetical protein
MRGPAQPIPDALAPDHCALLTVPNHGAVDSEKRCNKTSRILNRKTTVLQESRLPRTFLQDVYSIHFLWVVPFERRLLPPPPKKKKFFFTWSNRWDFSRCFSTHESADEGSTAPEANVITLSMLKLGVNVMITFFRRFSQIFGEKFGVFIQNQCQNANFFDKIFGDNMYFNNHNMGPWLLYERKIDRPLRPTCVRFLGKTRSSGCVKFTFICMQLAHKKYS